MIDILSFDPVKGRAIDGMHNLVLGIQKEIFTIVLRPLISNPYHSLFTFFFLKKKNLIDSFCLLLFFFKKKINKILVRNTQSIFLKLMSAWLRLNLVQLNMSFKGA